MYHESQLRVLISPGAYAEECEFEWKKKGKFNPVDPPPEQFDRKPPHRFTYKSFQPTAIYAKSDELWRYGLLPLYPVELEDHEVHLEDWKRFVEDVTYVQGRLGWRGKASYLGLGLGGDNAYAGYLIYLYFRKKAGKHTISSAKDLVELWNELFFNPRGVNITFQTPKDIEEHIQGDEEDDAPSLKRKKKLVYYMGQRKIPKERCRFLITPCYHHHHLENSPPPYSDDSVTLQQPSNRSPFSDIHAYEEEETLI
ncbi:hypothetical protein TRVA0_021S01772 [Trichomonascus vanleenenianus]|uniref:uncharacterized protein n=1 Tax=Trichomonascus vanleenenianus TaxID=2268995 RepID=UPI003ECB622D